VATALSAANVAATADLILNQAMGYYTGSDSMLMHSDGITDGESGGNRRHEPWHHACPLRTRH